MYYGSVNINLRPIKFAFLCLHNDKEALSKAIEYNSILWGGLYNPIIPIYKKTPKMWLENDITFKLLTRENYLKGLLQNFDPDYIVPLSKNISIDFSKYHIKILNPEDIFTKDGIKFGTSIFEVLKNFYDEELKFIRKNPINIISPKFAQPQELFLKSVFGQIPDLYADSYGKWENAVESSTEKLSIDNYPSGLENNNLFPRRLTGLYIDAFSKDSFEKTNIFYMDANNCGDIIDYWNLRAAGRNVLPIAKQVDIQSDIFKEHINAQIENGFRTHKHNVSLQYNTYVVKGRSIKTDDFNSFITSINSYKPSKMNFVVTNTYPSLWQINRRHGNDHSSPKLEVNTKTITISGNEEYIKLQGVKPAFSNLISYDGNPKYVNELEIDLYGDDGTHPQVLPNTNYAMAPLRALGVWGFDKSRLSSEGLAILDENMSDDINITLPQNEDLFFAYLKSFNINAQKANPGRITYRILNHIGGVRRLNTFAEKDLLLLMDKVSKGSGYITTKEFLKNLNKIKSKNKDMFSVTAEGTIRNLLNSKALAIGLEIECPVCIRSSWYAAYDLKKNLECPNCLAEFDFPTFDLEKETKWAYRFIGPFSLPDLAQGSYGVLLTLRFFTETLKLEVTSAFNFHVMKNTQQEYEIDLGFITKDRFISAKEIVPVFCESKSFGTRPKFSLTEKSISNIFKICDKFQHSVAVFSVLRETLTPKEKRLLTQRVISNYKLRAKRKPYSDIIILTGKELLSTEHLDKIWENGSNEHKKHAKRANWYSLEELAEATCAIHLGTPNFYDWYVVNNKAKVKK